MAEYKQKQKLEADAEEERQRRLAEAQNRIKIERAKQARQKAENERRKMHQLKRNAPRTETKLVNRKRGTASSLTGETAKVREYYRNKANNKQSIGINPNKKGSLDHANSGKFINSREKSESSDQNQQPNASNRRNVQRHEQDIDGLDEELNLVGFPNSAHDILNDKDHEYYLQNEHDYGGSQRYDDETIDDVYINDALAQVKKSQGERHKAKYVRQNIVRSKNNRLNNTTKAEKNYAWKDDLNQIDYDGQDFEDDLNDALEYHPNIPERGGTALKEELSALGLDGIDNLNTKNNNKYKKKQNRPQRKLLKLNEVGSYEYGAHGQLVPEGTLAWQQQHDDANFQQTNEPLSPLSRFIRQSDSQEFAAYKHSVSHEGLKSGVAVSPAPIVKVETYTVGAVV